MAHVETEISIDGLNIKRFSSLALSQGISEHHNFHLVCPAEAIDDATGTIFNNSRNLVGAPIAIQVKAACGSGSLKFAGVVTQVEASRYSGHAGDIIISGYSPTILLDNTPHCKSWKKKSIKDISEDVLKHFTENLIKPKYDPANSETLGYTVQYKETAWQFLKRLHAAYGKWFFYDGEKLVLSSPQGNKTKLVFGGDLSRFNMTLQLQPARFQALAHDYINNKVYESIPDGIAGKAGLNDLGKHALQKSEQFFSTQPKQWYNHFLTSKKQLDDFINTRAAAQSSNMVRFHGSSSHPGLQLGGYVTVQGKNIFNQADESFGEYTIISISHHCDCQGNYSNNFVAVPASIKVPPVISYAEGRCETQSAVVTDNYDKKGLGRIKVKFHWMNGSEKSPWLRIAGSHGGDGKGMFFIPEIGEEVIVGFKGDSAVKPYVIGTVYHGMASASGIGNDKNDIKQIKTRSGHIIRFDDVKEGSVTIVTPGKNSIVLDDKTKTVSITGADHINITSGESLSIHSKAVSITGDTIGMEAKEFVFIKGQKETFVVSDGNVIVQGKDNLNCSAQNVGIDADTDLKLNSGNTAALQGNITNVQGSSMVNIN